MAKPIEKWMSPDAERGFPLFPKTKWISEWRGVLDVFSGLFWSIDGFLGESIVRMASLRLISFFSGAKDKCLEAIHALNDQSHCKYKTHGCFFQDFAFKAE